MAGPWCNVIAGTGYIKSANDESLARDEGGGRNLFMEVATYKTVQGRRLRMTPATANQFSVCGCSCAQNRRAPKGGMGVSATTKRQEEPYDTMRYNQQT